MGKVLEKLYQAAGFLPYHVEWGRNDFGSAKYFSSVEDVIELLTGIDQLESKQLMERVERILLINDQSRGKALTNANRPKDEHLIALKKNTMLARVRLSQDYEIWVRKFMN